MVQGPVRDCLGVMCFPAWHAGGGRSREGRSHHSPDEGYAENHRIIERKSLKPAESECNATLVGLGATAHSVLETEMLF